MGDVLLATKNRHVLKQESVSSTSSSAYPHSDARARSTGTAPRSGHEPEGPVESQVGVTDGAGIAIASFTMECTIAGHGT